MDRIIESLNKAAVEVHRHPENFAITREVVVGEDIEYPYLKQILALTIIEERRNE